MLVLTCIALFDSGVGGLSLLPAIKNAVPHCDIVYLADHAHSPYGNKDLQWLNQRMEYLVTELQKQHPIDVVVIACNTASTVCLNTLRQTTNIPVVGVVPAIKTAAQLSNNNAIGILATPATIQGTYLKGLIEEFSQSDYVTQIGTTKLVEMAENKLSQQPIELSQLNRIIAPFIHAQCDVVVLGCTHFPHLIDELQQCAPHIHWIHSAHAIAKRCKTLLKNHSIDTTTDQQETLKKTSKIGHTKFYSTANISQPLHTTLEKMGFNDIQHLLLAGS